MYTSRYWSPSYWSARYWPRLGGELFPLPLPASQRAALAYYLLYDPTRLMKLAYVPPSEVLDGRVTFTEANPDGDILSLDVLRDSVYLSSDHVSELGALGRTLVAYDNPCLLRVGSSLPDAAFRLDTNLDQPLGNGDVVQRSVWKGLLYETQEEHLPETIDLPAVLPSVALGEICRHSNVVVPGFVDGPLDVPLSRFTAAAGASVWDALHQLSDAVAGELSVDLQRDNTGKWLGMLRADLTEPRSDFAGFISAPLNLLPGATRELTTTEVFSRVQPVLADGSSISGARFQVDTIDSVAKQITTLPGEIIGPADGTWTGKYIAFFSSPYPTAIKTFSTLLTADVREVDHWKLTLTAWDGSILFGRWFWFYEDAACTEPVGYLRHPEIETRLGVRTRAERFEIRNEIVLNANSLLSEGYVSGVPGGGYAVVGTPTVSRNTVPSVDLDGDGDLESLVLLGRASWKAVTSTINHGQQIALTLPTALDSLRKPLFIRALVNVAAGQIKLLAEDSGTRVFLASDYAPLFSVDTHWRFANLGLLDMSFTGVKVRVRLVTNNVGGTGTFGVTSVHTTDEVGNEIGGSTGTGTSTAYTADGATYTSEHTVFVTPPNSGLPAARNLKIAIFVSTGAHASILEVDRVTLQHTSNSREIVTPIGVRDNFDLRIGPWRPVGDVTVKVLNVQAAAATWYWDMVQIKRADGLTDERAPLPDSGANEAVRQAVKLWDKDSGERYSFTFRALDLYYGDPGGHAGPLRVNQRARVVLPELGLDDQFKIVELTLNDHSDGEVEVTLGKVPVRLSRLQARQGFDLKQQLDALAALMDQLELRIITLSVDQG